jgi:Flp pilus assembly CpaF family ATPase
VLTVVVHEKGGKTQRFGFTGDSFSVGREEGNDLVLDRVNVSKRHLRLRRRGGVIEVLDLESTNGTYVNGRRIVEPRPVRRADRIYVGEFILTLDGDDEAIAPLEPTAHAVQGDEGRRMRSATAVPPPAPAPGQPLAGLEDLDPQEVMTSARRVAPAGLDSSYLDRIAHRVLQAALVNLTALDPFQKASLSEGDRAATLEFLDGMIGEMARLGEIEEGVAVETLKSKIAGELLEYGPLGELMRDVEVREIQVVGGAPLRVLREGASGWTFVDRRFSGDRALVLAIQRLARKWGFLVEGANVLEGKVDDGFYMYALLPPSQAKTPVLSLRRNPTDAQTLEALVHEGVLSPDMRELLVAAVRGSRRILVCASGGANLDRFMGALVGEIPDELRVVCISDTGRLGASRTGWVQLRRMGDAADTIGLSDAIGILMRGGVDLLVSQRCRHEDAAAVMDAMAGATRGALVSLWGIDSAHALWRLAGLSTVAAGAIQALTVSLARSVDLLVRLGVGVAGEPLQIVEIVEPRVREGNEIVHTPLFRAVKAQDGQPTEFKPSGTVPGFLHELASEGISVPLRMFKG